MKPQCTTFTESDGMKPQCTTAAECLRELARVMEQFGISRALDALGSSYIKCSGYISAHAMPAFTYPEDWQFAIAEVEGKPVFIGDELYYGQDKVQIRPDNAVTFINKESVQSPIYWHLLSWNPPRPKTVMVEMLVEDAKWLVEAYDPGYGKVGKVSAACKKALEELK